MKICLLVTEEMRGMMPEAVEIIRDFGPTCAVFPEEDIFMIEGDHMYLEADQDVFVGWLKPYGGIAVTQGIPQLEEFSIMHIKEDV